MGRLRQAYGLADNEVEKLVLALLPDKAFPLALWQEAYETYWRGFANRNAQVHGVENPPFPVLNAKYFDIHLLSSEVNYFIQKLSYSIHSNAFRIGLQYIIDYTYDNANSVFVEEKNFLIEKLSYLKGSSVVEYDTRIQHGYNYFSNNEIILIPDRAYNFISAIFYASILVDKTAAIRLLHEYPLRHEVKGITQKVVQDILATPATSEEHSNPEPLPEAVLPATELPVEEDSIIIAEFLSAEPESRHEVKGITQKVVQDILAAPATSEEHSDPEPLPEAVLPATELPVEEDSIIIAEFLSAEPEPLEQEVPPEAPEQQLLTKSIPVPRALWEGKSPEAACAAMRETGFAAEVIACILFHKYNLAKRTVGKLLHRPNLTDYAYDKKARELYRKANTISIIDIN